MFASHHREIKLAFPGGGSSGLVGLGSFFDFDKLFLGGLALGALSGSFVAFVDITANRATEFHSVFPYGRTGVAGCLFFKTRWS